MKRLFTNLRANTYRRLQVIESNKSYKTSNLYKNVAEENANGKAKKVKRRKKKRYKQYNICTKGVGMKAEGMKDETAFKKIKM